MSQSQYTVKTYNPLHHSSTHQAPVVPTSPKEAKLLLQLTGPMLLLPSRFSQVQLIATPWTAAHQAPLSMGFSSKNTRVDAMPSSRGSNPGLPHCRQILYQLSHKGSPLVWSLLDLSSTLAMEKPSYPLLIACSHSQRTQRVF